MIDIKEFKVGDRVLAQSAISGYSSLQGRLGTIICISGRGNLGIEFDDEFVGGHNCNGEGRYGHCRYTAPKDTVLLIEDDKKPIVYTQSEELTSFLGTYIK